MQYVGQRLHPPARGQGEIGNPSRSACARGPLRHGPPGADAAENPPMPALRVLFICSQNKLRSPTAEQVFSDYPGIDCTSAGTNNEAENPLSAELVEWADIIFVMEKQHQRKLASKFPRSLRGKRVVCLGIPDEFEFMQPELVELLEARVRPHLR